MNRHAQAQQLATQSGVARSLSGHRVSPFDQESTCKTRLSPLVQSSRGASSGGGMSICCDIARQKGSSVQQLVFGDCTDRCGRGRSRRFVRSLPSFLTILGTSDPAVHPSLLRYATMFIAKAGSYFACLPRLLRGFHSTSTPLAALGLIGVSANGLCAAKPPLLPSDVRTIVAAGHHVQVEKSLTAMLPGVYESVRECSFAGWFRWLMIACRPVPKSWSASMRLAMWWLESTQPPFFSEFVMPAHPLGPRLSYLTSASRRGTRRHALPFTASLRLLRVQPG